MTPQPDDAPARPYRVGDPLPILATGLRRLFDGSTCPETVHAGIISVVDGEGTEITALGPTTTPFPLRSTAKPFQLLPYLLDGLHGQSETPELADLAVMEASHAGEPMHTRRVADILARWRLGPQALQCGVHPPLHIPTQEAMLRAGTSPSPLHCNCSGKHAGMLAVCAHRGWPVESYLDARHPLQRRIHALLAVLTGRPETALPHAIDGCSLPTFIVPVVELARLFARLAWPEAAPPIEGRRVTGELGLLFAAATRHPELVAGSGCLDTRLMQALRGRVFAKVGAGGLHALAVAPGSEHPRGLGIAIKVADGDWSSHVRSVVTTELLRQLGVTDAALESVGERRIVNLRSRVVGELAPAFRI
ncbi:MAG: asparaginase [Gammaproteobacteria bacterium]|nr:asparaginase [Gammaproteobacteria bacterium]NIR82873.1 asparaginase [Gammaproteobacteria bacterium]NIR89982.1 asparaginase [Gammaproteobacteria bacterium]NIU04031.1 asparaginase [Gammaproteobacteria bacterium]NIV51351.1 asparaginase [Gammaproteobacteria bacterium]